MRTAKDAAPSSTAAFVPLYQPTVSFRLRAALRGITGRRSGMCADSDQVWSYSVEPGTAVSAQTQPEWDAAVAEEDLAASERDGIAAAEVVSPPVASAAVARTASDRTTSTASGHRRARASAAGRPRDSARVS